MGILGCMIKVRACALVLVPVRAGRRDQAKHVTRPSACLSAYLFYLHSARAPRHDTLHEPYLYLYERENTPWEEWGEDTHTASSTLTKLTTATTSM